MDSVCSILAKRIQHAIYLIFILTFTSVLLLMTTSEVSAQTVVINFDQDAFGNDIPDGEAIDDEYSTLGVNFDGTYFACRRTGCRPDLTQNQSLNVLCTFSLGEPNVAACTPPLGGNVPLIIDLDSPVSFASIEGYTRTGVRDVDQLLMQAFDVNGVLVNEVRDTCTNGVAPHSIEGVCNPTVSAPGIRRLIITPIDFPDGLDKLILDFEVQKSADLVIDKVDSSDPVGLGEPFTYTVSVLNNGPDDATNVVVTDNLPDPDQIGILSVSTSQGSCDDGATGVITCNLGDLANGASATITLQAEVKLTAVGTALNTARVSADTQDPNPNNNQTTEDTTIDVPSPQADLAVTKTTSSTSAAPGDTVTYVIDVLNNGPDTATGIELTDTFPAQISNFTITENPGNCLGGQKDISCVLGDLASGGSLRLVVEVTLSNAATGTLTNNVMVTTTAIDPNPANNEATVTTPVLVPPDEADLEVTKSASADSVSAGDQLTYTIVITNNGPGVATGVRMTDTFPAAISAFLVIENPGSCLGGDSDISCFFSDLSSGESITFVVRIGLDGAASGTLVNSVEVSTVTRDPNLANNQASTNTPVDEPSSGADLTILKNSVPNPVKPGRELNYTLEIVNNGPAIASGVFITDTLPSETTFVSVDPTSPICVETDGQVFCRLGSLAAGASLGVTITVRVSEAVGSPFIVNVAEVGSDTDDPEPTNNQVTEETQIEPLAIELALFTAERSGNVVIVSWETESENDTEGFNILRSDSVDGLYIQLNSTMIPATGSPTIGRSYQFEDLSADINSTYYYRLEEISSSEDSTSYDTIFGLAFDIDVYLPLLFE